MVDLRRFVDRFFVPSAESRETEAAELLLLDDEDYGDTDWDAVFVDPEAVSPLN